MKYITVRQLREVLEHYDDDLPVVIEDSDHDWFAIDHESVEQEELEDSEYKVDVLVLFIEP